MGETACLAWPMKDKQGLEFQDQLDGLHADPWPICKVRTTCITNEETQKPTNWGW